MPTRRRKGKRSRNTVVERVLAFNSGRPPELLARKFAAMEKDPFVFFRGSAHLFWEDWGAVAHRSFDDAPLAWCCGDLHLENFGGYRGDNRLSYFDINDFDEGALAPATHDIARLLTSAHLAAESMQVTKATASALCANYLDAYIDAVLGGKARWVERSTAKGMIGDLFRALRARTRRDLLEERVESKRGGVRLRIDDKRTFAISDEDRETVIDVIARFAAEQPEPNRFRVLDVAGRIAGTGSLGIPRFVVLVQGSGRQWRQRLLDLKQARPSTLPQSLNARRVAQPRWPDEASRIVAIQQRMQAVPPALLHAVSTKDRSFVVRELQPRDDRLSLDSAGGRVGRLRRVLATMGQLTAWAQLRSAGRDGSACADELIEFGRTLPRRELLTFARDYAKQVRRDWSEFRAAVTDSSTTR